MDTRTDIIIISNELNEKPANDTIHLNGNSENVQLKKKKKQKKKKKKQNKNNNKNIQLEIAEEDSIEGQFDQCKDINQRYQRNRRCPFDENEFIIVKIEYIQSSREFWVYEVNEITKLHQLQRELNESYLRENKPLYRPFVNNICAVNYKDCWYRSQILQSSLRQKMCKVLLIDFGRMLTVSHSQLRMLKTEFININPMVTLCKLSILDQSLLLKRIKSTKNEANTFEMSVLRNFEAIMTHSPTTQIYIKKVASYTCEVYLYISGIDLDLYLNAYALSECYAAFCLEKILCNTSADIADESDDDQQSNNEVQDNEIGKKIPVILTHIVSPSEIFVIFKRYNWFLRNLHTRIQRCVRNELRHGIPHTQVPREFWRKGMQCVVFARDPNDVYALPMWYRAAIVDCSSALCLVRLRDFGTVIETPEENVLFIKRELLNYRNGAIKCHLSGLEYWPPSTVSHLKVLCQKFKRLAISIDGKQRGSLVVSLWGRTDIITDSNLQQTIEWTNINGRLITDTIINVTEEFVRLSIRERKPFSIFCPETNKCVFLDRSLVNVSMCATFSELDLGGACALPINFDSDDVDGEESPIDNDGTDNDDDESSQFSNEPILYEINDVEYEVEQWLPSQPIEKIGFMGTPTHVSNNLVIYLLDTYREYLARKIGQIIHQRVWLYGQFEVVLETWFKGQPCFAKFSDGFYYRGVILTVKMDQRNCLVKFVDYGDIKPCNFEDLRTANMFGNIPILARKYCLNRIRPVPPNENWPAEVVKLAKNILVGNTCSIHISNSDIPHILDRDICPCSIKATGWGDLKNLLIEKDWARHAVRQNPRLPPI